MRSPLTISYPSLIELAEEVRRDAERMYASAVRNGTRNLEPLRFRVENAKALVKMLKKCEPGKQADLFEIYKQAVR